MATVIPSVVCLGIIGRNNNPLNITILPSYNPRTSSAAPPATQESSSRSSTAPSVLSPIRTPLQFSLILSQTLDVFELRTRQRMGSGPGSLSGDLGLLCAVDERLSCYGYETNTGVKFVVVVDMRGRLIDADMPIPIRAEMNSAASTSTVAKENNGNTDTPSSVRPPPANLNENALAVPAIPPFSSIGLLAPSPTASSSAVSALPLVRSSSSSSRKPGIGSNISGSGTGTQNHEKVVASLAASAVGLREAELKPLFRAIQTAWVRLLQNPFFNIDEHVPPSGRGGREITSRKFGDEMRRLASGWAPGVVAFDGF